MTSDLRYPSRRKPEKTPLEVIDAFRAGVMYAIPILAKRGYITSEMLAKAAENYAWTGDPKNEE